MSGGGPPHGTHGDEGRETSPYIELDRAAWARLGHDLHSPLSRDEVRALRGLGDNLDLAEVSLGPLSFGLARTCVRPLNLDLAELDLRTLGLIYTGGDLCPLDLDFARSCLRPLSLIFTKPYLTPLFLLRRILITVQATVFGHKVTAMTR